MTERVLYLVVCGAGPASRVEVIVKQAQARGWSVYCLVTAAAATHFLDIPAPAKLTSHQVRITYREAGDQPLPRADAIVVAPATYNTINKWAAGISDNYVLSQLAGLAGLAGQGARIVVLPFVNRALAANWVFRASIEELRAAGVRVLFGRVSSSRTRPAPGAACSTATRGNVRWTRSSAGRADDANRGVRWTGPTACERSGCERSGAQSRALDRSHAGQTACRPSNGPSPSRSGGPRSGPLAEVVVSAGQDTSPEGSPLFRLDSSRPHWRCRGVGTESPVVERVDHDHLDRPGMACPDRGTGPETATRGNLPHGEVETCPTVNGNPGRVWETCGPHHPPTRHARPGPPTIAPQTPFGNGR